MGRIKGSKLSDEAKRSMREKRASRRLTEGKGSVFADVVSALKFLSFGELEQLTTFAEEHKVRKASEEKHRLIEEKQRIESQIQKLDGIGA
ncbi:MAG: oxysterol-binding protein [Tannerellaceae bacterium]|jgi:hypothetical protein|nr:oxysterol-binding protein [Tannerellaceae bacterium]